MAITTLAEAARESGDRPAHPVPSREEITRKVANMIEAQTDVSPLAARDIAEYVLSYVLDTALAEAAQPNLRIVP